MKMVLLFVITENNIVISISFKLLISGAIHNFNENKKDIIK